MGGAGSKVEKPGGQGGRRTQEGGGLHAPGSPGGRSCKAFHFHVYFEVQLTSQKMNFLK